MAAADKTKDAELDEGRMSFLEHLREFRKRLRNAAICFLAAAFVCWFFSKEIYAWMRGPLDHAWAQHADQLGPTTKMKFFSIVEPFWVYMSVSLWSGIFVSSPFIFYQLWKFIAPGLYKNERRVGVVFSICSAAFFVAGALFCYYFVLEQLFTYLLGYADDHTDPALSMREYFDLARDMMLAFGAVFELPILIYFLAKIGLVTHRGLWKFNRWFVVIAFVIGAILTPSPDVVSQCLMALPMILLYNLSIVIAYFVVKNREREPGAAPLRDVDDD
jgi:sec-independent protein translocase protein TatC